MRKSGELSILAVATAMATGVDVSSVLGRPKRTPFEEAQKSIRYDTKSSRTWVVYLVRCSDGSLYCGITVDLEKRLESHNKGTASKYTRSRGPVELAAVSPKMSGTASRRLESWVKKFRKPEDKLRCILSLTDISD